MEEKRGYYVNYDGGEEEGPGGSEAFSVAPSEFDDGGVLREVEFKGLDHRRGFTHGGGEGCRRTVTKTETLPPRTSSRYFIEFFFSWHLFLFWGRQWLGVEREREREGEERERH